MLAVACALALFHPILLCGATALVALSLFSGGTPVLGAAATAVSLLAAPFAAAVLVEMMYRWCFDGCAPRTLSTVAASAALTMLLGDRTLLIGLNFIWLNPEAGLHSLLPVCAAFVSISALSAAIVMCGVLLLELPLRWATSTFGRHEAEGLPKTLRLVAVCFIVGLGWPLLREAWSEVVVKVIHSFGA